MSAFRKSKPFTSSLSHGKFAPPRDPLWGKPVFKAPHLPNPRVIFDPLPFTATRVTHRRVELATEA